MLLTQRERERESLTWKSEEKTEREEREVEALPKVMYVRLAIDVLST